MITTGQWSPCGSHFPVSAVAEVEDPAPAASSADGQICGAEAAGADMAQCSEHSIEQIDP